MEVVGHQVEEVLLETFKNGVKFEACVEFVGRIMGHEIKNQRANEVSLL